MEERKSNLNALQSPESLTLEIQSRLSSTIKEVHQQSYVYSLTIDEIIHYFDNLILSLNADASVLNLTDLAGQDKALMNIKYGRKLLQLLGIKWLKYNSTNCNSFIIHTIMVQFNKRILLNPNKLGYYLI